MGKSVSRWTVLFSWALVLGCMILIFTCSAFSTLPEPGGFHISDKVKHFAAYAVLCVFAYRAFAVTKRSWNAALSAFAGVALAAFYGASDEFHQRFVPGRQCDVMDWLADLGGALTVALLAVVISYLRRRK